MLLSTDSDGDFCIRLEFPRSKTDQYNEGHIERLKGANHPLCPVRSFGRWVSRPPTNRLDSETPVFCRDLRHSLARSLKLSAVSVGVDFKRVSNHSIRSGGGSLMFSVGFEIDIIKMRGRWVSATFHQYLWRDGHVLSNIGI